MKIHLSETWYFTPVLPPAPFADIPADACAFRFGRNENVLNLDSLLPQAGTEGQDGAVYNRFLLADETPLAFGMGCDWWAEVRLNGEKIYSTFPGGNISGNFHPDDHAFSVRGRKGENLLAIQIHRGRGSWSFEFAEKDSVAADPCLPLVIEGSVKDLLGPIKPMNAVNNGPIKSAGRGNMELWKAAKIPFARNHDAAFCASYGGEHIVDVHAVFPDFSADPDDPASYDFTLTDKYLQNTLEAGTRIFYRLGSKIEHKKKKYGTRIPPDFHKWAVVCEHIIRHFNEGWADGCRMNIEYWEIWNEPDLDADDAVNKRTWQGTEKEFFELYRTAACHLKKSFPQLKIGGPALSGKFPWMERFLKAMSEGERVPLDFFSWHFYCTSPASLAAAVHRVRKTLDEAGYTHTESVLNEWNYVRDWGAGFRQTIRTIIGLKGAVFTSSVMCSGQNTPLDMLMYYDARPSLYNGIFDFYTNAPLKGYYAFLSWMKLAELGTQFALDVKNKSGIFAVGATDGKGHAGILINRYFEPDDLPGELEITLKLAGIGESAVRFLLLDESHDLTEIPPPPASDGLLRFRMKANTLVYLEYDKTIAEQ